MIGHLIAPILGAANAAPPGLDRERFYAIKGHILRTYGRPDGFDVQQIEHECWRCGGSGNEPYSWDNNDWLNPCLKCDGTGVYERIYIRLDRWRLGKRAFYIPAGRLSYAEASQPGQRQINGRVTHRQPRGYRAREAALWLALAFDRRYFALLMTSGCTSGRTLLPLVLLHRLTARLALRLGLTRAISIDGWQNGEAAR